LSSPLSAISGKDVRAKRCQPDSTEASRVFETSALHQQAPTFNTALITMSGHSIVINKILDDGSHSSTY
jgi:hypothetical protein